MEQYLQAQQYLQELRAIATSKNDEIIKYIEELREKKRRDETLSDELHDYYDWFYSIQIFNCEINIPLVLITKKIYDHNDTLPPVTESLDESFANDTYEQTYEKLKFFSEEKIRKYLTRYFPHSWMFNDICESVIGPEAKNKKFKEVMKKISEINSQSVDEFSKRICHDEKFERLYNQKEMILSIINSEKENEICDMIFSDTETCLFMEQNNLQSISNKKEYKEIAEYTKLLKEYMELSKDAYDDDWDCRKRLEQQIAQKGLSYCKDIMTNLTFLFFIGTIGMFVLSRPTQQEKDIIHKIFETTNHEEDINLVNEKMECCMKEFEKNGTLFPLQEQNIITVSDVEQERDEDDFENVLDEAEEVPVKTSVSQNDTDLIGKLKGFFFGDEEKVKDFLKDINGTNTAGITDIVNERVKNKEISSFGNSRKKPLWKILHDAGLYDKSLQNWCRRVH